MGWASLNHFQGSGVEELPPSCLIPTPGVILGQQDDGSPMRGLNVILGRCGLWTGWFAYEKYAHRKVSCYL